MNALAPTEISFLESLPLSVREEATNWESALAAVTKPIGKALQSLAIRFNCDYVTARRKYDAWRKHGLRGLVNCSKAAISKKQLLDGDPAAACDAVARNPEFCAYAKRMAESYQRKTLPAWRAFARDWKTGKHIPGLDNNAPRHCLPAGCGQDNFYRIVKDAFALEATRRGLGSAVAKFGPQVFSTRANLWYGSHLMLDDLWHDSFIVFGRQLVRVLELDALDVFSGMLEDFGCKPRFKREDGTFDNLKEKYARLLVAKIYFQRGYSPRGSTNLVEHGTAALSERVRKILFDYSGGLIKTRDSGITGVEQAIIGWRGQGKGNPRFKAALESIRNLKHNELAYLPAQTGKDRDSRPEYTHGQLTQASEELRAMAALAVKNPQRAAAMRLHLLEYHSQFLPLLLDVYREINNRTWHDLEGWHAAGNVVVEYRTAPSSPHWLSDSDFGGLPMESRNLIMQLAQADPRFIQQRKLSPAEVKARDCRDLIKLPAFVVCELLGEDFARELKVEGCYFNAFSDQELSPEPMLFKSFITTPDGRQEKLADDTYSVFVNPFDLDQLFVCDARLRCLGIAPRVKRVDPNNPEALKRAFGERAHEIAELKKPLLARHASSVREELDRLEHNAAVMDETKPYTPEEIERGEFVSREGAAAAEDILTPSTISDSSSGAPSAEDEAASELLSAIGSTTSHADS